MPGNNPIKFAFLISFAGHCVFLGAGNPGLPVLRKKDQPKEMKVEFDIRREVLLPRVDLMGPEKKFKPMEEKKQAAAPEKREAPPEEKQAKPLKLAAEEKTGKKIEEKKPEPLPGREHSLEQEKVDTALSDRDIMMRYQDMVKQRIEAVRRYPLWARKHGVEGISRVSFKVFPRGEAGAVRLSASSGSKIIDDESISTVRRASPFPPAPGELSGRAVDMEVSIVFSLKE
ncbi:MAG: TonB family protein [Candidatus Omnitrophica bacterium]|nr:TonB family protein [Candidatus Omnitrophota bacterium]MDD5043030.1 TonB family protein [Candidatus Omnitrophota bacterium]MDD5500344.1 TonB family protein [Candidatus Omnitrophota bacterium]